LEQRVIERTAEVQAREKFAAMGRMAARVAHEINNPLAGIKNAFRLIRKAIPQKHPSFQFVHLIDKEIDRIADIVRHMYDLYRPGQEKAKIFRLDAVIYDTIGLLEKNCYQHKVRIILEPLQSSVLVKLPEGAVRQILFNLLVNAIDASPQEGVVEVDVHLDHESVLVSVADHGKGIPQEAQEQIFQPFFTTKEATSSSGLGLGLSISKDLVEAMGGSLSFQSRAEQGAVFQVLFPLQSQHKGS
jgi:signal transduction histidine kinase